MKTEGSAACVLSFLGGFGLTRDRRSKIALYSLTVLCAFLSLVRMAFGMPQKPKASDPQNAASSIARHGDTEWPSVGGRGEIRH